MTPRVRGTRDYGREAPILPQVQPRRCGEPPSSMLSWRRFTNSPPLTQRRLEPIFLAMCGLFVTLREPKKGRPPGVGGVRPGMLSLGLFATFNIALARELVKARALGLKGGSR